MRFFLRIAPYLVAAALGTFLYEVFRHSYAFWLIMSIVAMLICVVAIRSQNK